MFSFLILVVCYLIPVIYRLIRDIVNGNYKYLWKWATAIVLLLIAVYFKSMNL